MARTPKLNDLQLILLSTASAREDGNVFPLAECIANKPAEVAKAITTLLKRSLVIEYPETVLVRVWREDTEQRIGLAITDAGGRLLATATPEQLARLARRGCRAHSGGDCSCPVVEKPAPTQAYELTDAQDAFVTTRDRGCRSPTAGSAWAGPIATTSSRTPAVGRSTARTCAVCAAVTTG